MQRSLGDPLKALERFRQSDTDHAIELEEALKPEPHEALWNSVDTWAQPSDFLELGKFLTKLKFEFWLVVWHYSIERELVAWKRAEPTRADWKYIEVLQLYRLACQGRRTELAARISEIEEKKLFPLSDVLLRVRPLLEAWALRRFCPPTPHVLRREIEELGIPSLGHSNIPKLISRKRLLMGDKTPQAKQFFAQYKHVERPVQMQVLEGLLKKWGPPPEFSISDIRPPVS